MLFIIFSTSSIFPCSIGSCISRSGPIKKFVNNPITPIRYNGNAGQKLVPVKFKITPIAIASRLNQKR
jgi:hypothetical protein